MVVLWGLLLSFFLCVSMWGGGEGQIKKRKWLPRPILAGEGGKRILNLTSLESCISWKSYIQLAISHNCSLLILLWNEHLLLLQVRNINARYRDRQALLGFVDSNKANIGLHALKDMDDSDANLDMIFSMNFMKKLTKRINKLHFEAIPKQNRHVQKIDKDWVEVIPSLPNSFEFHSSIYSCLSSCFPSEICVLYETM